MGGKRIIEAAVYDEKARLLKQFRLSAQASAFEAECYAIWNGTIHARSNRYDEVVILTDSSKAVHQIAKISIETKGFKVIKEVKAGQSATSRVGKEIKIIWIPARTVIFGNER